MSSSATPGYPRPQLRRDEWLSLDGSAARISSLPTRQQINLPVQEQLIVELYSK